MNPVEAAPDTYEIQPGDTLGAIARKYDLDLRDLVLWNNISDANKIMPGQVIKLVPPEVEHTVKSGESLWKIAGQYGVTVATIAQVNHIVNPQLIQPGQLLKIPTDASAKISGEPVSVAVVTQKSTLYIWPATGPISSPYGSRSGGFHTGMDIAVSYGTPIRATRNGKVVLSGWNGGYGYCVILEHPDGSRTLYGHCSRLKAKVGQTVAQGDTIAYVGSTGNSTGAHLHFEVIVGGKYKNPASVLP
jgi:murein DD-endopeptidase MepM/ murein hydrolase activator NlpD